MARCVVMMAGKKRPPRDRRPAIMRRIQNPMFTLDRPGGEWFPPTKTYRPWKLKGGADSTKTWRITEGDMVRICQGKAKGEDGKIFKIDKDRGRVWIEGKLLRQVMRYPGGDTTKRKVPITVNGSIHYSNVRLLDPMTQKPTRVSLVRDDEGNRVRRTTAGNVIPWPAKPAEADPPPSAPADQDTEENVVVERSYVKGESLPPSSPL